MAQRFRRVIPMCAFAWACAVSADAEPAITVPVRAERVVWRFDFDERAAGNLDEVPMYWEPLRLAGFPIFAGGKFDEAQGYAAPPSFYLSTAGRNAAYMYGGPETRVRPGGRYRVEGFIRPDRLKYARACLSAHFLDRHGRALLDTMARSREVGGASPSDWTPVDLLLPPAPPEAHSISVGAWVLQESLLQERPEQPYPITHVDVAGGAWFDDLTIYLLPIADLRSGVAGNVLSANDRRQMQVTLVDAGGGSLTGRVFIEDADGQPVQRESFSTGEDVAQTRPVDISGLAAGSYHARFEVCAHGTVIATRTLPFVVLGNTARVTGPPAQAFGLALDGHLPIDPRIQLDLLARQGVRSVKVPIWSPSAGTATSRSGASPHERFLEELHRRSYLVTAVLAEPPPSLSVQSGTSQPAVTWLSEDPNVWKDELAAIAAPFAGVFRWWQIGGDDGFAAGSEQDMSAAIENVRQAIRPFITVPRLALAVPTIEGSTAAKRPVEQLDFSVRSKGDVEQLPAAIQEARQLGYSHVSASVSPLPAGEYERRPRLAEFAQRVIATRHAGIDTVWVPQTWRLRRSAGEEVVEPMEEFILIRTLVDVLGDAVPGPRVLMGDGVHGLAFHAGDRTVLAMWDDGAPAEGRPCSIPGGRAERVTDLWSRVAPLRTGDMGCPIVQLSATPVFVEGVDRALLEFATSMALTPARIEAGQEIVEHILELHAGDAGGVSGEGVLEGPESIEITPRTFSFHVRPGATERIAFMVRYPHTEPAGRKAFLAKLRLSSHAQYMEVPLFTEFGPSDLDAWGSAVLERDDLVLRQVVSNRSSSVLSFRGSARVPGRERQYRPFANLAPGESQSVEYRFAGAGALIGRRVRLTLHELNDGPRTHTLELVVP